jgi:hypothetical protein
MPADHLLRCLLRGQGDEDQQALSPARRSPVPARARRVGVRGRVVPAGPLRYGILELGRQGHRALQAVPRGRRRVLGPKCAGRRRRHETSRSETEVSPPIRTVNRS